ncbi:unnamed protein product [Caenorhabditis nigoni]
MGILWILILISISHFSNVEAQQSDKQLRMVQILFRHGARAPTEKITDPSYHSQFPRGLGEMTDAGFENSYLMGRFLKKRYVDTGFLNPIMNPREMYWRSVNKNRCLSTASTVGFAMFDDEIHHLHVPVQTEEYDEHLLNYNQDRCEREIELVKERCPDFNGTFHPWVKYEAFIANCLNYTHPVFNVYPFENIEAYMNEYKNSIPPPKLIQQHLDEVMAIYVNVTHFITGTGNHHDPRMMRVKFGYLMAKLQKEMTWMKEDLETLARGEPLEHPMRKKFNVYSTQDWILMGVLDSLGVLKDTVGLEVYPEYNSMIILELWEEKGRFFVKTFYKKEEITHENHQLLDVSHLVRNCTDTECPFENFISCCEDYKAGRKSGCVSQQRKPRSLWSNEEDHVPQFAGPE